LVAFIWALIGNRLPAASKGGRRRGCLQLTHRSHSNWQDVDLRNLVRVISACTLGLWAFAAGLLIGTFLLS